MVDKIEGRKFYRCTLYLTGMAILLSIATGCRGDEPKRIPDTMPDVYGYINAISTDRDADAVRAMVMVKAVEGVEAKYREANISIDDKTLIEDSKGEKLTVEQLQEGQEIQAWFEGDVVETLPARGYVKAVRIKAQ